MRLRGRTNFVPIRHKCSKNWYVANTIGLKQFDYKRKFTKCKSEFTSCIQE